MEHAAVQLVRGSRLPRTVAALQKRGHHARAQPALRAVRRVWAACERLLREESTCARCARPMLEWCQRGQERVCIACVADERAPLAPPELAGATAVLRTLLLEAHLDWTWHRDHLFQDHRRLEAVLDTAESVLWWLTPPNLRAPNLVSLRDETIVEVLGHFDRVWTCKSSAKSLMAIYEGQWASQAKAQRHFELDAIDRKYAAIVASEPA